MVTDEQPPESFRGDAADATFEKAEPRLTPPDEAEISEKSDSPEFVEASADSSAPSADDEVVRNRRQKLETISHAINSGYYDEDEFLDRALIRMLKQLERDP